ncbi:MAG: hypothetical protein HYV07_10350 [Deltaproteobacteria bacterium]|nr:hypothetical protein [Deltaproteobacteria bacterium]
MATRKQAANTKKKKKSPVKKSAKKKSAKKKVAKKAAKATASKKKVAKKTAKKAAATKKPAKKKAAKKKVAKKAAKKTSAKPSTGTARGRSTLPPDHEVLPMSYGPGERVAPAVAAQAIREALKARDEHPIEGREFTGVRSRGNMPVEGDRDFVLAQEARRAAEEVVAPLLASKSRSDAEPESALANREAVQRIVSASTPADESATEIPAAAPESAPEAASTDVPKPSAP